MSKANVRSSAVMRLLSIGILTTVLCPLTSVSATYILPARADLGFAMANVSIPLADYTNCVAYYTAEAPVFNAGQANYFVPDLSPARNNATQPTVAYQPTVSGDVFIFAGSSLLMGLPPLYEVTYAMLLDWPSSYDTNAPPMSFFGDSGNGNDGVAMHTTLAPAVYAGIYRGANRDQYLSRAWDSDFDGSTHWIIVRRSSAQTRKQVSTKHNTSTVVYATITSATVATTIGAAQISGWCNYVDRLTANVRMIAVYDTYLPDSSVNPMLNQ